MTHTPARKYTCPSTFPASGSTTAWETACTALHSTCVSAARWRPLTSTGRCLPTILTFATITTLHSTVSTHTTTRFTVTDGVHLLPHMGLRHHITPTTCALRTPLPQCPPSRSHLVLTTRRATEATTTSATPAATQTVARHSTTAVVFAQATIAATAATPA